MRPEARCLDRGAEEGAGGALAVGSGDVEDGRQLALGIAEAGEERAYPFESERVHAGRQIGEAIELALDEWIIGGGTVGHGRHAGLVSGSISSTRMRWKDGRSEEHTSTPVTNAHLVCRLLLEKKKKKHIAQ